MKLWSRSRTTVVVLTVLLTIFGCSRSAPQSSSAPQSTVDRLGDRAPGDFFLLADSTWRRVLDPSLDEHRFTIAHADRGAHLLVFPGIEGEGTPGPVRFEVTWQNGVEPGVTIYRRELSVPGWAEEDIELPSPGPGELRLRKALPPGSEAELKHASWGDPILLSGVVPTRPSVILISLDTLRADRLGVYGRHEARTPALDALARNGVWYEHAYSSSTWTLPSHQSMLYGVQPSALGARKFGEGSQTSWGLEDLDSLASAFSRAGYLTGAFTGGGFVSAGYGLGRGFDSYFAYSEGSGQRGTCDPSRFDGAEVFGRATRWLRKRAGAPFFLFIHTYEPHDRCPVTPVRYKSYGPFNEYSPEERQSLIRYYDNLVTRTDGLVGDLLRELDSLGLAGSTVVVVTSDHGEALWEHGFWGHGCGLPPYEELSRVPLIVRLPTAAQRTAQVEAPVSTVDLAPTLLALADIPVPHTMQGGMLPGLGLQPVTDRPVYVHCGDWLSVRRGDLKFLISRKAQRRMLFSTRDDPGELVDLVAGQSANRDELRQLARDYWSRGRKEVRAPSAPLSTQQLEPANAERLRALGY